MRSGLQRIFTADSQTLRPAEHLLWRFLFAVLISVSAVIFVWCQALCSEDPDVLYEKGRFAEAEKIYADADMDNPDDLRYRYNRGCAAYQNSDLNSAMSAFSSVLRRAGAEMKSTGKDSRQIAFKAAYNLGNTAFRLGDFQSAAEYYRQALMYDSGSGDVMHNLELALREAEKQKNQEKEKEPESEKSQDQSQDKNNQEKADKKKEGRGGEKPEENADDNRLKDSAEPEEDTGKGADQENTEQDQTEDLSGELEPLRDIQTEKGDDQAMAGEQEKEDGIDRKRAAALLDNIKEDPSRLPQFQLRGEAGRGVGSGKDW